MSIYKHTKHYLAASLLLLGSVLLTACSADEISHGNLTGDTTNGLNLTLSVKPLTSKVMTKATSERTDRSRIERLDIVLANGDEITEIINIDKGSTELGTDCGADDTGLVGTRLPIDDPKDLNLHIGSNILGNATHVYLVANYINEAGRLTALPDKSVIQTVTGLKALRQGVLSSDLSSLNVCTMFGETSVKSEESEETDQHPHSSSAKTVKLTRTIAMITLAIDGNGLRNGVVITPTKIELRNVPLSCSITGENKIEDKANISEDGMAYDHLESSLGLSLANSNSTYDQMFPIKADQHGEDNKYPLYMLENLQEPGINTTDDDKKKEPSSEKKPLCSYIQVTATYEYTGTPTDGLPARFVGTILYRFYLGGDITNNFEVKRNTHYQLTLNLNNWGGLEEKKVIQGDKYLIENSDDAIWRVDYSEIPLVVDDRLEVPAGGSRVEIRLDKAKTDNIINQGNNVKISHNITGNNNYVWLKNTETNWDKQDPSQTGLEGYLYADEEDSNYYILKVYLKPIDHGTFDEIAGIGEYENNPSNPGNKPLSTIDDWKTYGYREVKFSIGAGSDVYDEFTIRQWLPLPVMDPEDVKESKDPRDAKLFYSRFDIYHGKPLPWATGLFEKQDLYPGRELCINEEHLRIKEPGTTTWRKFEPEYGFHNTVAYFVTAMENNTQLDFNDGEPTSIMEYAFFEAANADEGDKKELFHQTSNTVDNLSHYGLASVTEWNKIMDYGVRDDRYRLVPGTWYWTSTIPEPAGKNTVYKVGKRETMDVPRNDKDHYYSGRMVYHRDDEATPLKPAAPAHPNN